MVLQELVFCPDKKLHQLHSKNLNCMKMNGGKKCLTFPENFLSFLWRSLSSISVKISSIEVSLPLTELQMLFLFCARAEVFTHISFTHRHNQLLLF